jgi:hypothetical protein
MTFVIRDTVNGDIASLPLPSAEVALERIARWVNDGDALPGEFFVTELDSEQNIVRHHGVPGHPQCADRDAVRLRRAAERLRETTEDAARLLREIAVKQGAAEKVG